MDVKEAVALRRSIRAFKPEPVSREILTGIVERALWAPSWGNTQPWKLLVVGGWTLKTIARESAALFEQGEPTRADFVMPEQFSDDQNVRYRELGKDLLTSVGIQRGDTAGRNAYYLDMMRFFDASWVVYLSLEKNCAPYALMDGGILLQTIALLAAEAGLGSCFLARSVAYPDVVKRHAGIEDDRGLAMGLAVGIPDPDHPINRFERKRGAPEDMIQWISD
ncbi:MAG: nitroreductase [Proteobacteria bacterium]|nr:nitroreductase [Pseudomonadota bacterium]